MGDRNTVFRLCFFVFMDKLEESLRKRIAKEIRESLEWSDQGPLKRSFLQFCNALESMQPLDTEATRTCLLLAGYTPSLIAIHRPGGKEVEYEITTLGRFEDLN